jgi:hypothetical protein
MEQPWLPDELVQQIKILYAMIPLYEQWLTVLEELEKMQHHIYNWPLLTMEWSVENLGRQCWITSIKCIKWYGNRISMVQYGDNISFIKRGGGGCV